MTTSVKLSKLTLSPINARKRPVELLEIPQMAADIEARGVLQNLLITPATKPRGTFEVFDGGRRLRGLLLLAERGVVDPETYEVPVKVLVGDEATISETSTAANFHQLRMTPAEECRAFQHFIGLNNDIDGVAKRFGVTRRFVEGRLRLATLAEPIFDALSEGSITLDVAKAYASTENQEKQLHVWNAYGQSYVNADTIRRVIANETMKSNEPVAILVGEERYVEAGGKVDRDLFSDAGDRWVDPEVAQRLASDIMETEAKRIGEESGLAWIRPIASSYAYNHAQDLYRVRLDPPELNDEQAARLEEIETRRGELEELMQDEELSEEQFKLLDAEDDALMAEAEALENRLPVLPDELKPHVGAFLLLTPQGEMRLDNQYFSEQPIERLDDDEADGTGADDEDGDGEEGERIAGGFRIGGGEKAEPRLPDEAVGPGGKPLSARLYDELAMQRRDVLAASILADPALALNYALFTMVDARNQSSRHLGYHSAQYGSTMRAGVPQDPISGDVPVTRARQYLADAHDGLDAAWTEPADIVERFEAFRALSDDAKAAWLAYIVAISLEAKGGFKPEQIPLQNRLASILEIDVASWWRPTAENFFDRVNKATILSLLNEVGGGALTARHATLKKTEISASCEKLFAGESIVEPEVKDAALAWIPNAMRFLDRPSGNGEPLSEEDGIAEGHEAEDTGVEAVDEPAGTEEAEAAVVDA